MIHSSKVAKELVESKEAIKSSTEQLQLMNKKHLHLPKQKKVCLMQVMMP